MKAICFYRCFHLMILLCIFCTGCNQDDKKLIINIMEMKGKGPGWGLAVVIQTPDNRTYLFDTGSNYPNAGFDAGKDMIAPFLMKNNVNEIDGVIITHSHNDHFGGFPYLMNNFKIKKLYDSGYSFTSDLEYDSIYKPQYISNGGIYERIKQKDVLDWGKDLYITVLSPPPGYLEEAPSDYTDPIGHHNPNLNSVSIRIQYKKTVFLLTGDVSGIGLQNIADNFTPEFLKANVLCPSHGGSPHPSFAKAVSPEIVIISGLNGVEGPSLKSKEGYGAMGAVTYSNCWNGTIQVVSDGNNCTVNTERNNSPYRMNYDSNLRQYVQISN